MTKMKHETKTSAVGAHSHLRYIGDKLGYISVSNDRDVYTLVLQGWSIVKPRPATKQDHPTKTSTDGDLSEN